MRRRLVPRRPPAVAAAALAVLIVFAGGWMLLRGSSLFAVEQVAVRGTSGPDGAKVEAALTQAARRMTTLNVDGGHLYDAVKQYPTVKSVSVDRDLPHGVTLIVHEKTPVATVEHAGRRVPLAADGRLLTGATAPDDVPALDLSAVSGSRISDARGRELVALVAAAPTALRRRTQLAQLTDKGLTLQMDRGPELYFGTASELHQKWQAVSRVLADPTTEGATYIDVRVPGRAAAGGLAPLVQEDPAQETPATAAPSTSTGA